MKDDVGGEQVALGTRLLSRTEAAKYLGVSLTTFQEHVQSALPAVRIGRRLLFDVEDLKKWVDQQKQDIDSAGKAASRMYATRTRASSMTMSPQERAMKEALMRPLRESSPASTPAPIKGTRTKAA